MDSSDSIEQQVSDIQKKNKDMIKSNKREADVDRENVEKRILERHSYLYKELEHCTDVNKYKELWKEYAELDMKVARIKNDDLNARSRCEFENQYKVAQ